jgi:hypothetical protein
VHKNFAQAQPADAFGFKTRPKLEPVYELSLLPPRAQRLPKA